MSLLQYLISLTFFSSFNDIWRRWKYKICIWKSLYII